ncbi:peptide ABC transporter permease [Paraburkholderia diazotrophica]|uniref:peptide ABC transporter permease n=1 Tax=Paraburkholderia diazotrophica TaxID=667676 RepID=UPI00319E6BEC
MVTLFSIAFAVRTASQQANNPVKLGQAQQLVAAALGYKSVAAFQASGEEAAGLDEAVHFVPDEDLLLTRAHELGITLEKHELMSILKAAFKDRHPASRLHASDGALDDFIRDFVQDKVLNHSDTAGSMAMTNNDGIGEVYLPFDDVILWALPVPGEVQDETVSGHVSMTIDIEHPYVGHRIDVTVRRLLARTGRVSIAAPVCEIMNASLDFGWGDDDHEDGPPTVSLAQALADELGLDVSETDDLVDAEVLTNESDDGVVYSHVFDFSPVASAEVAEKLVSKYGTLEIEVPPWFFDRVAHAD